jgi:hypothetical protein
MRDNDPILPNDLVPANGRGTKVVPVLLLCVLAAAIAINFVRGRSDQTFSGVVIMDLPVYKFYPEQKDCGQKGTPYLLIPNSRFGEIASNTADIDNLDALMHASWRVKLRGNLSHLGRYGPRGIYWREFHVQYVIDAVPLDCKATNLIATPAD